MQSYSFIITSLIIVLLPGTGVLYTISNGLTNGKKSSIIAAFGCTLGIIPHIVLSIYLSSFLLKMNEKTFFILKILGSIYLLYLGINMFISTTKLDLNNNPNESSAITIILRAILINLLNPKLTLFFFSFLPQYISSHSVNYIQNALLLGLGFMLITLIVFIIYGLLASFIKSLFMNNNKRIKYIQKIFAVIFIIFSIKLAISSM